MGLISKINIFKKREADDYFLVLDIGNSSVKALIVKKNAADSRGYILGHGQAELSAQEMTAGQITDIHAVADQTGNAIETAVQMAGVRPVNTVVGLSSPQILSQINKIIYKRLKPKQKLHRQELNKIITDINTQSQNQLLRNTGLVGSTRDYILVNAAILHLQVDGVTVQNPLDFVGEQLEFTMYQAFAPLMLINAIQSVADDLKLNLLATVYTAYGLAKTFAGDNYRFANAWIIDIGEHLTDLVVYENGILLGTATFAFGVDKFSTTLAKELDIPLVKANQYVVDYSQELLVKETENQLVELFAPIAKRWFTELLTASAKLNTTYPPHKIYLAGGGANLPEISQTLSESSLQKIHPIDVVSIVDKTTILKNPQDIGPLALVSLALHFEDNSSPTEKMFRQLMQTLRT